MISPLSTIIILSSLILIFLATSLTATKCWYSPLIGIKYFGFKIWIKTLISSSLACIDWSSLFFNTWICVSVLYNSFIARFAIFSVPGSTGEATINVSFSCNFNFSSPPSIISKISWYIRRGLPLNKTTSLSIFFLSLIALLSAIYDGWISKIGLFVWRAIRIIVLVLSYLSRP